MYDHAMVVRGGFAVLVLWVTASCGSDANGSPGAGGAAGTTTCEKSDTLRSLKGCTGVVTDCTVASACEQLGRALGDCIARDLSQCLCEADGDLNCEGSWKPNEGPALCIDEHQAFADCDDANN
jgi:hypothetical protein